jgi:hypothetical protein
MGLCECPSPLARTCRKALRRRPRLRLAQLQFAQDHRDALGGLRRIATIADQDMLQKLRGNLKARDRRRNNLQSAPESQDPGRMQFPDAKSRGRFRPASGGFRQRLSLHCWSQADQPQIAFTRLWPRGNDPNSARAKDVRRSEGTYRLGKQKRKIIEWESADWCLIDRLGIGVMRETQR